MHVRIAQQNAVLRARQIAAAILARRALLARRTVARRP
jgi:hypothetical protein